DVDLQEAAFDAYNDWMVELCSHAPQRLTGLALISIRDVGRAVRSLERWRQRGLRGAMISAVPPTGTEYGDPPYEPLWSAIEDLGIPVSLHTLTSSRRP